MTRAMVTLMSAVLAWTSVARADLPAAAPYADGNRLSRPSRILGPKPIARSGNITIDVHASSAPNSFGSPSWTGYVTKALVALEGNLATNGDRSTDPTAYERAADAVPPGEIAVTSFNSWRGRVAPAAPFAAEFGNRMHFGVHAYGDGSTQFTLEDLTFEVHSDDATDSLIFTGDFVGYDYSATRYGIDWVDGIKGNGNDIVYNSSNGTTLVDEIVYVGVGNAWWPSGSAPQADMDDFFAWVASEGLINVTCTYSINGSSGSDSVLVTYDLVNDFAGSWKSWDTRDPFGNHLNGTHYTHPLWGGLTSDADDAAIAKQIMFLGEGQVAAMQDGTIPPAGPGDSLHGKGYLRLDATNQNSGKADLSFVDPDGLGEAADLLGPDFFASYRFYSQPMPTERTVGFNIGVIGTDANVYAFLYILPGSISNTWQVATVDGTSLLSLYGPGAPGGAVSQTLADWQADATWGPVVFGPGATVYRVGFNLGSSQRNNLQYIDWIQTSLLEDGELIDFVGPSPITKKVFPSLVPDEERPVINVGDAPAGFGPDSWQNTQDVGGKVNWHVRYLADGDYLSKLFPDQAATLTINDIASIRYSTKRPAGTAAGEDWSLYLYTRPFMGGDASWYGHRFINNFEDHTETDEWTAYTTDADMTFRRNSGTPSGHMDLATLKATYGTQLVEMISVQTHSNFANFDGYVDGLVITLTDGSVGRVDFVKQPTITLEPDDECYADGETVTVEIWMNDVPESVVGTQFFLDYDTNRLTDVSATPEPPFGEMHLEFPAAGEIDYALYILPADSITGSALLAVLTFKATADLCGDSGLVTWHGHSPPTRLSTQFGEPIYPDLMELAVSDTEPPVITCPADAVVECDDSTDPSNTGEATATDNCSSVGISHTDSAPLPGCGMYTYSFTRTWKATDLCGNEITCEQEISVVDTTKPTFEFVPPDATVECDASLLPSDLFGIATGGVAVYYNAGGPESPANQAFFKAQIDGTNDPSGGVSGMPITFDNGPLVGGNPFSWHSLYSGLPYPESQFGLDFVLPAPTNNGSVPVPALIAYDNATNDVSGRISAGAVTWAINNYQPHSPDIGAGEVINSIIRSVQPANPAADVVITKMVLTENPPIYTMEVAGKLVSDGTNHWYTLGQPDGPMSNFGLNGDFYFEGTLTYASTGDPGNDLIDFYSGTINVYANSPTTQLEFARAVDNCDALPTVSYLDNTSGLTGCNDTGTIIRTWTATDACSNSFSVDQEITVEDTTDPVLGACPDDITVNADAGICGAVVTFDEPGATDNCGTANVTCDWPSGSTFPVGTTTVTCTAEDACGNESSCTFDVTVESETELLVDVKLAWNFTGTRCLTFELWDCNDAVPAAEVVTAELEFAGGLALAQSVFVPCGSYTCITARDELHSLRRTVDIIDDGTTYSASFTGADVLVGGNLNDDKWIDILDFGVYSWQFATTYPDGGDTDCATPYPHADISGNGAVGTEDFTFIQISFLAGHEANCCGALNLTADEGPIEDITIAELERRGLSKLALADLNRDGRLNELDIAAFAAGARPKPVEAPVIRQPGRRPGQVGTPVAPRP